MIVQHATREDWLRERLRGIGGSDAPAVLGVSSYSSAMKVWSDRVAPSPHVDPPPAPGSPMAFGLRLERGIAEEVAAIAGYTLGDYRAPGSFSASVVLDEAPYMRSTPDFPIVDRDGRKGILQIKNVDIGHADQWRDGAAPDEYIVQTQHELLTCQSEPEPPEFVALAACIGGNRATIRTYGLDEEFASYWLDEAEKFWRCVETRTPPSDIGGPGAAKAALNLHRRRLATTSRVLDPAEWASLAARRLDIARQQAALKAEAEEIDARALLAMGSAAHGEVPGVGRILVVSVEATEVASYTREAYSFPRWYGPAKSGSRKTKR